jgi:hypothetical protein
MMKHDQVFQIMHQQISNIPAGETLPGPGVGRLTTATEQIDSRAGSLIHSLHQEEAKSNQESQDMKQIPSTYQVFLTVGACPTLSGLLAQQAAIGARLEAVEATPVPWPSLLAAWQISTDNEAR